eukprot:PhM_4_TR16476/c0_g1_i1/m.11210
MSKYGDDAFITARNDEVKAKQGAWGTFLDSSTNADDDGPVAPSSPGDEDAPEAANPACKCPTQMTQKRLLNVKLPTGAMLSPGDIRHIVGSIVCRSHGRDLPPTWAWFPSGRPRGVLLFFAEQCPSLHERLCGAHHVKLKLRNIVRDTPQHVFCEEFFSVHAVKATKPKIMPKPKKRLRETQPRKTPHGGGCRLEDLLANVNDMRIHGIPHPTFLPSNSTYRVTQPRRGGGGGGGGGGGVSLSGLLDDIDLTTSVTTTANNKINLDDDSPLRSHMTDPRGMSVLIGGSSLPGGSGGRSGCLVTPSIAESLFANFQMDGDPTMVLDEFRLAFIALTSFYNPAPWLHLANRLEHFLQHAFSETLEREREKKKMKGKKKT